MFNHQWFLFLIFLIFNGHSVCSGLARGISIVSGVQGAHVLHLLRRGRGFIKREATRLNRLLQDMTYYKTTNKFFHAGDLLQHSLWTEEIASAWLSVTDNPWSKVLCELDEHTKFLLALASLLHDVGKAGDCFFNFETKKGHNIVGYEYIMGSRVYRMKHGEIFDFKTMFSELGISPEEQKLIALLIGMHLAFGEGFLKTVSQCSRKYPCVRRGEENKESKVCREAAADAYLAKLDELVKATEYNSGRITGLLVRMAIFVGVADAKGNQPVEHPKSIIFAPHPLYLPAVRKTKHVLYEYFYYDTYTYFVDLLVERLRRKAEVKNRY